MSEPAKASRPSPVPRPRRRAALCAAVVAVVVAGCATAPLHDDLTGTIVPTYVRQGEDRPGTGRGTVRIVWRDARPAPAFVGVLHTRQDRAIPLHGSNLTFDFGQAADIFGAAFARAGYRVDPRAPVLVEVELSQAEMTLKDVSGWGINCLAQYTLTATVKVSAGTRSLASRTYTQRLAGRAVHAAAEPAPGQEGVSMAVFPGPDDLPLITEDWGRTWSMLADGAARDSAIRNAVLEVTPL